MNHQAWLVIGAVSAVAFSCSGSDEPSTQPGAAGSAGNTGQGGHSPEASLGGNAGAGGSSPDASSGGGGGKAGQGGTSSEGGMVLEVGVSGSDGSPNPGCPFMDDQDHDGDGYSAKQGDCNDCEPNANPGAFDDGAASADGGPPKDWNCDGKPGGDTYECDDGIDLADSNPLMGAKAIGLCRVTDENASGLSKTWGVLDARYVKADGTPGMSPLSHGVLATFGQYANAQQGKALLVLSSGTARAPSMPGYQDVSGADMGTDCALPIPSLGSPSCPGVVPASPRDPAALEVRLRVPTNARSFKFFLSFFAYEFPDQICSQNNDFFVTLMNPKPAGSNDGNITFDQDANPISVNNSMLQVCKSQYAGGKQYSCPLGTDLLAGTGFETGSSGPHAATGWLQTAAPVTPGSIITLRFAIWDGGDHVLDSSVLVDNFTFSGDSLTGATTEPVSNPK
ncbi:MAG: choice-of-anchor L domain-containing protein [Deltaproteobacteria bacterium]|nr:choice-of-anchor L domain-containing protein [Deltaproteobacteria bacterium]